MSVGRLVRRAPGKRGRRGRSRHVHVNRVRHHAPRRGPSASRENGALQRPQRRGRRSVAGRCARLHGLTSHSIQAAPATVRAGEPLRVRSSTQRQFGFLRIVNKTPSAIVAALLVEVRRESKRTCTHHAGAPDHQIVLVHHSEGFERSRSTIYSGSFARSTLGRSTASSWIAPAGLLRTPRRRAEGQAASASTADPAERFLQSSPNN